MVSGRKIHLLHCNVFSRTAQSQDESVSPQTTEPPREIFLYDGKQDEVLHIRNVIMTPSSSDISTKQTDESKTPLKSNPRKFTFDGFSPQSSIFIIDSRDADEDKDAKAVEKMPKVEDEDCVRENRADTPVGDTTPEHEILFIHESQPEQKGQGALVTTTDTSVWYGYCCAMDVPFNLTLEQIEAHLIPSTEKAVIEHASDIPSDLALAEIAPHESVLSALPTVMEEAETEESASLSKNDAVTTRTESVDSVSMLPAAKEPDAVEENVSVDEISDPHAGEAAESKLEPFLGDVDEVRGGTNTEGHQDEIDPQPIEEKAVDEKTLEADDDIAEDRVVVEAKTATEAETLEINDSFGAPTDEIESELALGSPKSKEDAYAQDTKSVGGKPEWKGTLMTKATEDVEVMSTWVTPVPQEVLDQYELTIAPTDELENLNVRPSFLSSPFPSPFPAIEGFFESIDRSGICSSVPDPKCVDL